MDQCGHPGVGADDRRVRGRHGRPVSGHPMAAEIITYGITVPAALPAWS